MPRLFDRQRRGAIWRNVGALLLAAGASTAAERLSLSVPGPEGMVVSAIAAGDLDGRRVIFVHGTPGSASGWAEMLESVPPGGRWIAVDRPGFGETRPPGPETRLAIQSAALEPFLPRLGEPGAVLVGHSLAGAVVADAAVRFPGRVSGVVIAAGALDPDLEQIYWIQHVADWAPIAWLLPRSLRNANRELLAFEGELRALAPRLAELRCPVVVVHGTDDGLVPFANVAYMQRRLAHTELELVVLEGASHFLPWDHEDTLRSAIAALLRLR